MAGGAQISSLHLAIAAGGGVLLYAALRGVSPVQALRDIASGEPPAVSTQGKWIDVADTPGVSGSTPWHGVYRKASVPSVLQRPATLIAAANHHASEKYSQSERWATGHSDCASFVGKSLLDTGISPPGGSVTTDYMSSADWVSVDTPKAGDIAVNGHHMILCLDGANGIGQQNSRRNVVRDTIDNLMTNTGGPFEIRRYRGWM